MVVHQHPVLDYRHMVVEGFHPCLTRSHFLEDRHQVVAEFPMLLPDFHLGEQVVGGRH